MSDMLTQIRSLGDQLRWAAEISVPLTGLSSEILYAGMGGSGIAGDFATPLVEQTGARIHVHKGYGPVPLWAVRQRPLVIAASFSGNTEEVIDFSVDAHEKGLQVTAVTTGGALGELARSNKWPLVELSPGVQPRAAIGQMFGAVLRVLEGVGAVLDQRLAFREAASLVEREVLEGSRSWSVAQGLAEGLKGRIAIIYGGGPVSIPVAQRWKTQINENAKVPAWWSTLPELNHNELAGWESLAELTKEILGLVALIDVGDHGRIEDRLAHTALLTKDALPLVGTVSSSGDSVLARLMSLTVVGDLLSWMLAVDAGVDPVPVAKIESLKALLSKESE